MSSSEKDQSDFNLERFIDMFDEALTSKDERVTNALRQLMMMVILTKPDPQAKTAIGPFRELFDNVSRLSRRVSAVEQELARSHHHTNASKREEYYRWDSYRDPYSLKATMDKFEFDSEYLSGIINKANPK